MGQSVRSLACIGSVLVLVACGSTDPSEVCKNVNAVCGEANDCSTAAANGASEAELQCKLTAPTCDIARACSGVTAAEQSGSTQ